MGHSAGGTIVNIFASQYPELVKGIINVEGNFTIDDAFWRQSISEKDLSDWETEYEHICSDPEKWLDDSQISLTPHRLLCSKKILSDQQANTVQAVAKAVVRDTNTAEYMSIVNQVADSEIPVYLVAGEYSIKAWHIPISVRESALELCILKGTGHMMMLEKPEDFCKLIERIIAGD